MDLNQAVVIAVLVLLVIGLIAVIAVVVVKRTGPDYPVPPAGPPELVGFNYLGTNSAWPEQTFYRYTYVDVVSNVAGPWSGSSTAVSSVAGSMPILEVVPTGTTTVVWQRRTESDSSWQNTAMVALDNLHTVARDQPKSGSFLVNSTEMVALTLEQRVKSSKYIDMNNPAGVPSQPRSSPFPSVADAKYVDRKGLSWNLLAGSGGYEPWRKPCRFACRLVGIVPSDWGSWSDSVWRSDTYTSPGFQLPNNDQDNNKFSVVQYTGSWFRVEPDNNQFNFVFHLDHGRSRVVRHRLVPDFRSTIDLVLDLVEESCWDQAGVRLKIVFDPKRSLVGLILGENQEVLYFDIYVDGLFQQLGFTSNIVQGRPGHVYKADTAPLIQYDPVVSSGSFVTVVPPYDELH